MSDDRPTEGDAIARRFREAEAAGDTAGMAAATAAMRAYVDQLKARDDERALAELNAWSAGHHGWWGDDPAAGWWEQGPDLIPPADDTEGLP